MLVKPNTRKLGKKVKKKIDEYLPREETKFKKFSSLLNSVLEIPVRVLESVSNGSVPFSFFFSTHQKKKFQEKWAKIPEKIKEIDLSYFHCVHRTMN